MKQKSTIAIVMSTLLNISEKSYYRWKKKDHKTLISLLEMYHSNEEIQEFLETGKISKYERIEELLEIEKKYKNILEITKQG